MTIPKKNDPEFMRSLHHFVKTYKHGLRAAQRSCVSSEGSRKADLEFALNHPRARRKHRA